MNQRSDPVAAPAAHPAAAGPHNDGPVVLMQGVQKRFGGFQVLDGIDLQVSPGERVVICGPSGSGKSTLLRCVNGLERHDGGRITVLGRELVDLRAVDEVRRRIGICFQQFNLFPHLTALENCTLAPVRAQGLRLAEATELALHHLDKLLVADQAHKHPAQLSGGQQQRVAIARALCLRPQIMLFDEPTSALDPEMILEVLEAMVTLAREGMTMICVTHEMRFAREVADRIVFMDQGRVLESARPDDFFLRPAHTRTREFLAKVIH